MLYKIYEYLAKVVIHWLYNEGKGVGMGNWQDLQYLYWGWQFIAELLIR